MKNIYGDLFLTFARIGGLTFGGGYAMLPMLQKEVVENRGWVTEEELTDCYAVGQCTPGVIAVNTATYIGYKMKGIPGGIFATLGVVTPSLVIITLIAAFLQNFSDIVWVKHAFAGIRVVVTVMVLGTVIKLFKSVVLKKALWVWLLYAAALLLAVFTPVSSAVLVVSAAVIGLLITLLGKEGR